MIIGGSIVLMVIVGGSIVLTMIAGSFIVIVVTESDFVVVFVAARSSIALVILISLAAYKDLAGLPEVQGLLCGRQLWKLLKRIQPHKAKDVAPG